jgi:hypothetical protein
MLLLIEENSLILSLLCMIFSESNLNILGYLVYGLIIYAFFYKEISIYFLLLFIFKGADLGSYFSS